MPATERSALTVSAVGVANTMKKLILVKGETRVLYSFGRASITGLNIIMMTEFRLPFFLIHC